MYATKCSNGLSYPATSKCLIHPSVEGKLFLHRPTKYTRWIHIEFWRALACLYNRCIGCQSFQNHEILESWFCLYTLTRHWCASLSKYSWLGLIFLWMLNSGLRLSLQYSGEWGTIAIGCFYLYLQHVTESSHSLLYRTNNITIWSLRVSDMCCISTVHQIAHTKASFVCHAFNIRIAVICTTLTQMSPTPKIATTNCTLHREMQVSLSPVQIIMPGRGKKKNAEGYCLHQKIYWKGWWTVPKRYMNDKGTIDHTQRLPSLRNFCGKEKCYASISGGRLELNPSSKGSHFQNRKSVLRINMEIRLLCV